METQTDTTQTEPRRGRTFTRAGRIKLRTLDELDGRTQAARRAKQLVADIASDLGGEENLTAAQRELVQRVAVLGALLSDWEMRWVAGEKIPLADYMTAINVQRRVLVSVGLERRIRDVTPTIDQYFAARDREEPDDE